ncbi:hypothetical protein ACFO1B_55415 [Dactylosporangium siamense]|uniref:Uncharacterized protein n=1 Tax=Dactylosporangium siamense TaxID=685454 RepID=A0A919Q1E3_9ACTN|nr:hypothetical protein [Dactylosporangium siamense]GIG53121.1 hypothetical protein Dsi01nite_111620 [Dactylosporangium siamense]
MTATPPTVLIGYDTTGYPMVPATAPAPRVLRPTGGDGRPRNRRTRRWIRSTGGAVAVLLVAATAVRCSGIGPTESPESLVRSVFAALTAHDGQRLNELAYCSDSPLCAAGGLAVGYQAPEHFEIVSSDRGKDHRVIKIRYTVGGDVAEDNVELARFRVGFLSHRWQIMRLPGAHLDVRTAASDKVHVAGLTVAPNPVDVATGANVPRPYAPPGVYTVAIDADALYAATSVPVVVAGSVDPPPTVLTPTLRPELQGQIEQQIRDRISYCADQRDFHPSTPDWRTFTQTCPFGFNARVTFTKPPTWTVEQLPKIVLSVDDHAAITVRTTSAGVATVRYQWSTDIVEPRRWTDASGTVEFTIRGQVGVKDNVPYWVG